MLRKMAYSVEPELLRDVEPYFTSALSTNSDTLQNINIAFANIMNRFHIFFLYESLKTEIAGVSDFVSYSDYSPGVPYSAC